MNRRLLPGQCKVISRIQESVSIEPKAIAVKGVSSGFERLIEDGSRVAAVFRIDGAGNDCELADRIRVHYQSFSLDGRVVHVCAVKQIAILFDLRTIRREATEAICSLNNTGCRLLQSS